MSVYVGAASPESLVLVVSDATFPFADVTEADVDARLPNGESLEWDWTLDASTPGQLRITHEFAEDGSDVPLFGTYSLTGWLVTPSTRRRITPSSFDASAYP